MSTSPTLSIDIPRKVNYNLNTELELFSKSNQYDYDQTVKRFKMMDIMTQHKKQLLKPIKKQNKLWQRNLERCYEIREEKISKQKEKIELQLKKRSKKVQELLSLNKSIKNVERERRLESLRQSLEEAKERVEANNNKVEEERLVTETKVTKTLGQRSRRQAEEIEKIRAKFAERNKSSECRYENNNKILIEQRNDKEKKDSEQKFDNFMRWYFFYQGEKKKMKKKKDKQNEIRKRCIEKQIELEEGWEKQRFETESGLKQAEEKRLLQMQKKHEEIVHKIKENKFKTMQTKWRKSRFIKDSRAFNKEVMKVQIDRIFKSHEKDTSMEMNKNNIQEKIILTQIELNRRLSQHNYIIDKLKSSSISKKSEEQKLFMYREKLRLEEERRKEAEEKEKKKKEQF